MRSYFDVDRPGSDQTARERIAGKLLLLDESFGEDLPLIFDFLAVPDPDRPSPRMDPEARQRQLLGLTKRLVRAQSARDAGRHPVRGPALVRPRERGIRRQSRRGRPGHARPERSSTSAPSTSASWMSKSYYRQIALAPLGPEAIEEMLRDLLGSDPSLNGLPDLVRERTAGNPFFIEEVVQSLVEAGNLEGERGAYRLVRPVAATAVPASVQAVLSARIDRLAGAREGRAPGGRGDRQGSSRSRCSREWSRWSRSELEEALRELVAGEFVFEQELYPEAVYAFKHPLTQEVAYCSQLGERRAALHAAVARAIAERVPGTAGRAGRAAGPALGECRARRWRRRAGTHAPAAWVGTKDPTASLRHWRKVRELADALPDSEETAALGLSARIFALNYGWRLGMSHEEAEALFTEAERLAASVQDLWPRAILLITYGTIRATIDGQFRENARLARQAIALAEESGDPALYMVVSASSYAFFLIGEYGEGVANLDRAIDLADGDPTIGAGVANDCPLAFCLTFKGGILCDMGRLEEGGALIERGMKLAGEQGASETVGWSHMWSTWHAYWSGEPEKAMAHAQQALEIAERIGDSFSRTWSWFWLGCAAGMRGEWRQAVEAIERSQAISRERRTAVDSEGWCLVILGEAYLGLGEAELGLNLLREAVALMRSREQAAEAVANVALARALLGSERLAAREEIESALERASELTRSTGMRSVEPMIHVELAELAHQGGDDEERREELREAHRLFTEIGATGHAERLARSEPAMLPT